MKHQRIPSGACSGLPDGGEKQRRTFRLTSINLNRRLLLAIELAVSNFVNSELTLINIKSELVKVTSRRANLWVFTPITQVTHATQDEEGEGAGERERENSRGSIRARNAVNDDRIIDRNAG